MKKYTMILSVALLIAGALTTGCSSDDLMAEEPVMPQQTEQMMEFTTTMTPKGSTMRSVDADGKTAWVAGEQIAIYYQKTDDSYATATATVGAPNGDGSAPITATLSGAKNGGAVKFVYPATLHNGTGDIDATALAAQHGTIADISANFDACTGSGTLVTNGTTCGTTANVAMTNQVLIGKFTPKYSGAAINAITTLTVTDGTNTYTVTPTSGTFGTTGIYVAMLPVSDQEVIIIAGTASQKYGFGGKKITLTAGKLYNNLAIAMLKAHDLTAAAFTADEDAFIYQSSADATSNTITIGENRKVILSGVNIRAGNDNAISCNGSAEIVLSSTNTVKNDSEREAVVKAGPAETTLTISGVGAIDAQAAYDGAVYAAVIGAQHYYTCGNITITGGSITASFYKGNRSAAIGAGGCLTRPSKCGDITITGGTVIANSIHYGAGIGSGSSGVLVNSACGDITITGGNVTATAGKYGAGIGSGNGPSDTYYKSYCGNITITGGNVRATGGDNAAGIGSGYGKVDAAKSVCGIISISGGTINATGGAQAAGIGTGNGTCGTINITGGTIDAYRDATDADTHDIGKGKNGTTGTVTIAASVHSSAGKYYTNGSASEGYNKVE